MVASSPISSNLPLSPEPVLITPSAYFDFTEKPDAEGNLYIIQEEPSSDKFLFVVAREDSEASGVSPQDLCQKVAQLAAALVTADETSHFRIDYQMEGLFREEKVKRAVRLNANGEESDMEVSDEQWNSIQDLVGFCQTHGDYRTLHALVRSNKSPDDLPDILQEFEYKHTCLGVNYGTESAQMFSAISSFIQATRGIINSLNRRKENIKNQFEIDLVEKQIRFHEMMLNQAINHKKEHSEGFVDSNYFRDLLKEEMEKKAEEEGRKLIQPSSALIKKLEERATIRGTFNEKLYDKLVQQEAIKLGRSTLDKEEWKSIYNNAADRCVPFLVNCWRQHVKSEMVASNISSADEPYDAAWVRVGAFYDARCCLYSLKDLLGEASLGEAGEDELNKRAEVIVLTLKKRLSTLDKFDKKSVGVKKGQAYLANRAAITYILEKMCDDPEDFTTSAVNPDKVRMLAAERLAIAQSQFISLLQAQLAQVKSSDKAIDWVHLSLLKPDEDKIERGWTHVEANECLDLKWVFDHFRGCKVEFVDGNADPEIKYDEKGRPETIVFSRGHIGRNDLGHGEPLLLNTYCVNCSVSSRRYFGLSREGASSEKAMKIQKKMNEDFYKEVVQKNWLDPQSQETVYKYLNEEQKKRVRALFEKGQSDFYAAEDISTELLKRGFKLSVNCQSAKDRTGYVCSRICQRMITSGLEEAKKQGKIEDGVSYRLSRYLLNISPFHAEQVTGRILSSNTGAKHVKCMVANMPGNDPLNLQRVRNYVGGLAQLISPTKKIRQVARQRFHIQS